MSGDLSDSSVESVSSDGHILSGEPHNKSKRRRLGHLRCEEDSGEVVEVFSTTTTNRTLAAAARLRGLDDETFGNLPQYERQTTSGNSTPIKLPTVKMQRSRGIQVLEKYQPCLPRNRVFSRYQPRPGYRPTLNIVEDVRRVAMKQINGKLKRPIFALKPRAPIEFLGQAQLTPRKILMSQSAPSASPTSSPESGSVESSLFKTEAAEGLIAAAVDLVKHSVKIVESQPSWIDSLYDDEGVIDPSRKLKVLAGFFQSPLNEFLHLCETYGDVKLEDEDHIMCLLKSSIYIILEAAKGSSDSCLEFIIFRTALRQCEIKNLVRALAPLGSDLPEGALSDNFFNELLKKLNVNWDLDKFDPLIKKRGASRILGGGWIEISQDGNNEPTSSKKTIDIVSQATSSKPIDMEIGSTIRLPVLEHMVIRLGPLSKLESPSRMVRARRAIRIPEGFPQMTLSVLPHGQVILKVVKESEFQHSSRQECYVYMSLTKMQTGKDLLLKENNPVRISIPKGRNSSIIKICLVRQRKMEISKDTLVYDLPKFNKNLRSITALPKKLEAQNSAYTSFTQSCFSKLFCTAKIDACTETEASLNLRELETLQIMLQTLFDWYLKTGAFKEIFWCPVEAFSPMMRGDLLGFSWDSNDDNTRVFKEALEGFLEALKDPGCEKEFFAQRKALIRFVKLNLDRMCCIDDGHLIHDVEPVWVFEKIEVRVIPNDDCRPRLRGQLGVYASENIRENEIIGPYVGFVYSDDSIRTNQPFLMHTFTASRERYEMTIKRHLAIDSSRNGNRLNFVNDYRLVPEAEFVNQHARMNCDIRSIYTHEKIGPEIPAYCATRYIYKGEEILADYGPSYWDPSNQVRSGQASSVAWSDATTKPFISGAADTISFLQSQEKVWEQLSQQLKELNIAK